jgi:hypothetical protein
VGQTSKENKLKYAKSIKGKISRQRMRNKPENKAKRALYHKNYYGPIQAERRRLRRKLDPDRYWEKDLKKYGITPDQYIQMMFDQNGLCAICEGPETHLIKGKLPLLAVDHDHETGKVRGLLCSRCNNGIGHFKDSPTLLQRAASYVEKR